MWSFNILSQILFEDQDGWLCQVPLEVYSIRKERKNLPFSFTNWLHGFQRASMFKLPFDLLHSPERPAGQRLLDGEMEGQGGEVVHLRQYQPGSLERTRSLFRPPIMVLQSSLIVSPPSLPYKVYPSVKRDPTLPPPEAFPDNQG